MWPTVWLSLDWCCVLHQPVASQVYLLQLTPPPPRPTASNQSQQRSQFIQNMPNPVLLPGIISLFITCVGIIWNNSLVGGRARAEVWTAAPEHITRYCTWRPSALTTGLHRQVISTIKEQRTHTSTSNSSLSKCSPWRHSNSNTDFIQ